MALKLFGTDGIRGTANKFPMTGEFAFRLAEVLARLVCLNTHRVAIGKDTRVSSYMIESSLIAGFTTMGVDVVKMRVVPTPLMTAQIMDLDVDMGIMITASHNPYRDNGIKLIDRNGDKFSDVWTAKVEELLTSNEKFIPDPDSLGKVFKDKTSVPTYISRIMSLAPSDDALKGLRLVIDCANGAFSKILPNIFKSLGAGVIVLSNTPDGYNINQDCGSQHTEHLSDVVIQSHAHLGIAVDGDGDRLIVVDDQGARIDGDQIIAFLATYLKMNNMLDGDGVVATIWSNLGLEKYLHGLGINFYRTPVGERYVIEKMRQMGAVLGGEESGHIVLSNYTRTGDALVAALFVCFAFLADGRRASQIFPVFEKFPCEIQSVRYHNMASMQKAFDQPEVQETISLAEQRIGSNGSVIVRKSGTEAVIKVKVEGEDRQFIANIARQIVEILEQYMD